MALAAALIGLSIFLSMSRGAMLALFAMLFFYGYKLGIRFRTVAVFALFLAVIAVAAPDAFWKRLTGKDVLTGAGRTDIWVAGTQIVKHHLFSGVGISNFPVAYNAYAGYAPTFKGFHRDSHNTFLNILSETGLVGLVLFLLALYSQFRSLERARGDGRADRKLPICLQATLVGMLAAAFFIDFLWTKGFWFTLILCTFVSRADLNEETAPVGHPLASRELLRTDAVPGAPYSPVHWSR